MIGKIIRILGGLEPIEMYYAAKEDINNSTELVEAFGTDNVTTSMNLDSI